MIRSGCFFLQNTQVGFRFHEILIKGFKYINTIPLRRNYDHYGLLFLFCLKQVKITRKIILSDLKRSDLPVITKFLKPFKHYVSYIKSRDIKLRRKDFPNLKKTFFNYRQDISDTKYFRKLEAVGLKRFLYNGRIDRDMSRFFAKKVHIPNRKCDFFYVGNSCEILPVNTTASGLDHIANLNLHIALNSPDLPSILARQECLNKILHLDCTIMNAEVLSSLMGILPDIKNLQVLSIIFRGNIDEPSFTQDHFKGIGRLKNLQGLSLDFYFRTENEEHFNSKFDFSNLRVPSSVTELSLRVSNSIQQGHKSIIATALSMEKITHLIRDNGLFGLKKLHLNLWTEVPEQFLKLLCNNLFDLHVEELKLVLKNGAPLSELQVTGALFKIPSLKDINFSIEGLHYGNEEQSVKKIIVCQADIKNAGTLEKLIFRTHLGDAQICLENFEFIAGVKSITLLPGLRLDSNEFSRFIERLNQEKHLEELNLSIMTGKYNYTWIKWIESTLPRLNLRFLIFNILVEEKDISEAYKDMIKRILRNIRIALGGRSTLQRLEMRLKIGVEPNILEYSLIKYDRYECIAFFKPIEENEDIFD